MAYTHKLSHDHEGRTPEDPKFLWMTSLQTHHYQQIGIISVGVYLSLSLFCQIEWHTDQLTCLFFFLLLTNSRLHV